MRQRTKRVVRGFLALILALALAFTLTAINACAATIFESGTLGPTGIPYTGLGGGTEPGSSGVRPEVFSGVRFELSNLVQTTRIGGHFVADPRIVETSLFGSHSTTR